MKTNLLLASALAMSCVLPTLASAQEAGTMTLGLGLHGVMPKSDNGTILGSTDLDVGDNVRPTVTFEYFVANNIGIEVLGALPFLHDIDADGLGKIGSTKHLPPVVSVQYHFNSGETFSPFVGVGVNYTAFFDEKAKGAVAGSDLDLDDSWGLALHAGFDYKINEKNAFRTDVRWIDIDSDVKLDGAKIGEAEIDPWVFGVAYVHTF
ncbi:OmpW/AlkL family protein [Celeribacter indicus]|uniref:OmpW family protein n=1 Tax=Celeribacter indicus TaxID=1208324 RepID=A0A0B5DZT0_9RHOB|nr:OmpW family outer membrane protein [Celeribacter indicus]AJE46221.1 OmpW family protein [Celeribacter indicus]SDW50337.1 outer membrane protein [Celeribacter indicus]